MGFIEFNKINKVNEIDIIVKNIMHA